MKRRSSTSSLLRLMVLSFLLVSFVSSSCNISFAAKNIAKFAFIKKGGETGTPIVGFTMSDQEKEIEGCGQIKSGGLMFFIDHLEQILPAILLRYENRTCQIRNNFRNLAHLRIYIPIRKLLI